MLLGVASVPNQLQGMDRGASCLLLCVFAGPERVFMNRRKMGVRFFLLIGLSFLPALAQATTIIEPTFPGLVHQAEVIAVGTVTGIQEQWDAARQAPITLITFSNLTVLKGDPGDATMTLEFLGGHTLDGRVLTVAGVPRFAIGEKHVVFCAGNHRDFCPLVGLWQGLLRVTFDPQRGEEIVNDNFQVPITGIQDGKFLKLTPEVSSGEPLSLSIFLDLIKQEMGNAYSQ